MTASPEVLYQAPMDCAEVQKFVHPYIDGEFGADECARLSAHAAACARCRELVAFEQSFKASLRARLPRSSVSAELRARIGAALDSAPAPRHTAAWHTWRIVPIAAAAGLLCVGSVSSSKQPAAPDLLTHAVVATHALRLPIEVQGPNPRAVGLWFDGKVPFAVDPPQIPGASLVGARLGYVHDREAADLQYQASDGRRFSVLIFDPQDVEMDGGTDRPIDGHDVYLDQSSGYNVAAFRNNGLGYAVTGDLPQDQMDNIVSASFVQ